MATLTIAYLLFEFRAILFLLVLAILVSAALRPLVTLLIQRLKIPQPYATIVTYLLGTGSLLLLIILNGNNILTESQNVLNDLAATYEARYPEWEEGSAIEQGLAAQLPPPDKFYELIIGPVFGQEFMAWAQRLFSMLGAAAVVLVLSVYWTVDQARLERYWLSLLPTDWRVEARRIWREMERGIGAYFRSEIIQSLTAVILLTIIYSLMGVEYAIILAGLAALAWVIPLVGAILAVVPVLAVGLFTDSLGLSIVAALATTVILSGLELLIEPRLFNRRRYNSTMTVILMLIFVQDFGIMGIIMAPPIAAAIQIMFNHLLLNIASSAPKKPAAELSQLQGRLDRILELQAESEEPVSPAIENLTNRLSKLLDEANQITAEKQPS